MKLGIIAFLCIFSLNANAQFGLFKSPLSLFKTENNLPDPSIFENWTCNQLYSEAVRLEGNTMRFKKPVVNASMDRLVTVASTVYKPVLVYYGYKTPKHFWKEKEIYETTLIMDNIRYRMSALHCFEK